jgi:hypothetical protein
MEKTKKLMISTTPELDLELEKTINLINSNKITGELSKSKIIRIAVSEWLDRQKRALAILKEYNDVNKTPEEILKENGY